MPQSPLKIIFFGNGPLADYTKAALSPHFSILFHARSAADLEQVQQFKAKHPDAFGILASFGVLLKKPLLELFEPHGIINLHPSLLPQYRGASPIETAILNGDTKFGVSIMKLALAMDAGPLYYQTTLSADHSTSKDQIYQKLAALGADWLIKNLATLPAPQPQNDQKATFTAKLTKDLSPLQPDQKTALQLHNQIRAFQHFPKSTYDFFGQTCIILESHLSKQPAALSIPCQTDQSGLNHLVIDRLQPLNKRPMDATAFLNGYRKK